MNDDALVAQLAATLVAGDLAGQGNTGQLRYFVKGEGDQAGQLNASKAIDDAWLLLNETRERSSKDILGKFKPKFKKKL
jgi:hypothetical protein